MGCVVTGVIMSTTNVFAETLQTIEVAFGRVKLVVDGVPVDNETLLYDGTTYVPLKAVSELLGKRVDWDGETNTAYIYEETRTSIPMPTEGLPPTFGSSSTGREETKAQPSYVITVPQNSYDINTELVTVNITNTSETEGGFSPHYRIEQQIDGEWTAVSLDISVTENWLILPAGETQEFSYKLFPMYYDYLPGNYRIVMTGVSGEPVAEFTLN
jgi:hypothetical protein